MAYWRSYMEAMIAVQQAIVEREASAIEEAAELARIGQWFCQN